MKSVALVLVLAWSSTVLAQTAAPPPPPMPMPAAHNDKAAQSVRTTPRRAIELSPAERQAIDARELKAVKPASVEEALQPKPAGDPDNAKIERDETSNTTRIDQYRTSNRISEVVVTPAGSTRSYSMTNREGRQPFGTTQMTPGLSVPNFFKFEFGRPTPAPQPTPAPPQSSVPAKPSN